MINLLPPIEKEKILSEKKINLIIILWVLALLFVICLILILLSIKLYIGGQAEAEKILLEEYKKDFGQSENQILQKKIESANINLIQLKNFYDKKVYLTETLEKISEIIPEQAYLDDISITYFFNDEDSGFKVSLSGFILTRELLFELKNNLENSFDNVNFPPANWVESNNINFSATFNLNDNVSF